MEASELLEKLKSASTATLTMVLLKRGIRNTWLRETRPISSTQHRIAGPAFTLRFIAGREDLATPQSLARGGSTRAAIEAMPSGMIAVVDAQRCADVGIWGDILCERMARRGAVGLVTDGAMRDVAGVRSTGLPVFCSGVAAPASISGLTFVGWQEPISCGGVAILPNDLIVADDDGAVVIPAALAEDVALEAVAQEHEENWILDEVRRGGALPGLYPMNGETRARYEPTKKRSS